MEATETSLGSAAGGQPPHLLPIIAVEHGGRFPRCMLRRGCSRLFGVTADAVVPEVDRESIHFRRRSGRQRAIFGETHDALQMRNCDRAGTGAMNSGSYTYRDHAHAGVL